MRPRARATCLRNAPRRADLAICRPTPERSHLPQPIRRDGSAPTARPDDGQLDVVTVADRPPLAALRDALHLFRNTLDRAPGVATRRAALVEIAGSEPILYHVDGEAVTGGSTIIVQIRPASLRVRVP